MPRSKPVILDTRTFKSMTDATEHFRGIIAKYQPGQRINDEDAADVLALLARHDEYDDKVAKGISHFEVMIADFNSRCFCIVHPNGEKTDFSMHHCISGRKSTLEEKKPAFPINLSALRQSMKK